MLLRHHPLSGASVAATVSASSTGMVHNIVFSELDASTVDAPANTLAAVVERTQSADAVGAGSP